MTPRRGGSPEGPAREARVSCASGPRGPAFRALLSASLPFPVRPALSGAVSRVVSASAAGSPCRRRDL